MIRRVEFKNHQLCISTSHVQYLKSMFHSDNMIYLDYNGVL